MSDEDRETGGGLLSEDPPVEEEGAGARPDPILLIWPSRTKMLLNPVLWTSMAMVFGISCCLVGGFVAIISKSLFGLLVGAALFAGFMVLVALIGAVVDLFGGFRVTFTLTDKGVLSVSGKEAGVIAEAAIIGGLLTGNTQAVGTGMLARSGKSSSICYKDVKKVKVSRRRRYILVKGGFGEQPIGLSCTPENFEQALSILQERCPQAVFTERSLPI